MRLSNKTAIITGAGAGIGEATAIRIADEGARSIFTTATEREWIRQVLTKEPWTVREAPLQMLKRVGEAREGASAILFLASDEASFTAVTELLIDSV